MPILEIEMVVRPGETFPENIAPAIAEAAAGVFDAPEGTVWTRFRKLPVADYAENGISASQTPTPTFVRVLRRDLPEVGAMEIEVAKLAAAIAKVCSRPVENVHILYEPPAAGRIAFGGELNR